MASKIKVDALETADGTGTIALSNQLTGLTSASMPTGSVLQVVSADYGTEVTSTSATYADTGLTATITPTNASNKILVCVSQNGLRHYDGNTDINLYLQKDGSNWKFIGERITNFDSASPSANSVGGAGGQYLDTPGDTSAHTYKTQYNNRSATGSVRCQDGSAVSSIVLMEIAG